MPRTLIAAFTAVLLMFTTMLSASASTTPREITLYPDSTACNPVIFLYESETPASTAILICPGGGYSHLAMDHEGHQFAQWLNSLGITAAVLRYRMPEGRSEVPGDDARRAMTMLRDLAGIAKVGIMGFSAGGHLASTVATHYEAKSRPDFQILFYPVVTMDEALTHRGSRDNLLGTSPTPDAVALYSNELQVTSDTPAAIIFHSDDDHAVPVENSLNYYSALHVAGVPASLHVFPTGGHGWGFHDNFTYKEQWIAELCGWLAANGYSKK